MGAITMLRALVFAIVVATTVHAAPFTLGWRNACEANTMGSCDASPGGSCSSRGMQCSTDEDCGGSSCIEDPHDCDETGNCAHYCYTGQSCSLVNEAQSQQTCCCPSVLQNMAWRFTNGTLCPHMSLDKGCRGYAYC